MSPTNDPTSHGTLNDPTVASLLARLFAEAEASDAKMRELFGALSPEERARRMSDPNADYRQFYGRAKELYLAVSPETARLLYMLVRATRARAVVEFGTSFGISTIHLAAAPSRQRRRAAHRDRARAEQGRPGAGEPGRGGPRPTSSRCGRATPWRRSPAICRRPSISCFSTGTSRSIRACSISSRLASARAPASSPTTPTRARTTSRVSARRMGAYVSVPFAEDVELSMRL